MKLLTITPLHSYTSNEFAPDSTLKVDESESFCIPSILIQSLFIIQLQKRGWW